MTSPRLRSIPALLMVLGILLGIAACSDTTKDAEQNDPENVIGGFWSDTV